MADGFHPIKVQVGLTDPPVALVLRQLDGLARVAFSCEGAEIAAAIDLGEEHAQTYGLGALASIPTDSEAAARARRFCIELIQALTWAWVAVEGVEAEDLWDGQKINIAHLVRFGDPELGVAPLVGTLGGWFNGPMLLIDAEGELYGPSRNGDGAAGPNTAPDAVH